MAVITTNGFEVARGGKPAKYLTGKVATTGFEIARGGKPAKYFPGQLGSVTVAVLDYGMVGCFNKGMRGGFINA